MIDLGDIAGARAVEHYILLWLRLWRATGGPQFNIAVIPCTKRREAVSSGGGLGVPGGERPAPCRHRHRLQQQRR